MANERLGFLEEALTSYSRAISFYERARGSATSKAARTTPFIDEMERWAECALYRHALLTVYAQPAQAASALRAYEVHESRWPGTFRQPQRNVIRALFARLTQPNEPSRAAPQAPKPVSARTTATRRPRPAPTTAHPFSTVKSTVVRLLQQDPGFPRANESNAHPETLAEQLVESWRSQCGANSAMEADDVVTLLYGLAGITFRSQTIQRLLVHMLFAAEAYAEAYAIVPKYMALVDTTWKAHGVPAQRSTAELRAIDGPREYVDTVLLGAHIALRYMNDPRQAQEWVDELLLVGTSDKSSRHRFTMEPALLARTLRSAGEVRVAQVRLVAPAERTGLMDDARVFLQDSLSLDNDASETCYILACILALERQFDDALKHARRALELEPAFVDAWHLIVLLLSARKDFLGARNLASEALAQVEADDDASDAQIAAGSRADPRTQLLSFDYPPTAFQRAGSYIRLLVTHNVLLELTMGAASALDAQRDLFAAYHVRVAPLCVPPAPASNEPDAVFMRAPSMILKPKAELAETPTHARNMFRARLGTQLLQRLWLLSAASFRRIGDLEQSRCAIAEAEQLDARFAEVWVQLAQWCLVSGPSKAGAAVTCLYKALSCDTNHVAASVHLARVLLRPSEQLNMRASHAESIAAVASAASSEQMPLSDFALADDPGIASAGDAENHARATPSRGLGGSSPTATNPKTSPDQEGNGALGDVALPFRWQHDPTLSTNSMAEALLRTVTLFHGWDVSEAWHTLGQLAQQTKRSVDVQRRAFLEALRLESTRPIRPWNAALDMPL